ncbi:Protein bud22 [Lasiodiplodia hormozganensis]|uniref:Protein bud22 n=1 Tax=Lasiodiplodia hormozganensis TaxID=869390 RepID=A0AA39XQG8_9PEZI|nr:Protein bud22 [Lasiodiplodia hormozganensis]
MPKRKRDEPSSAFDSSSSSSEPETTKQSNRNSRRRDAAAPSSSSSSAKQRKQLPTRLEQAKKELVKALKIARGFERQKLSRRRKAAEKDNKPGDVQRIDAEIEALKKIEYQKLAEAHLYKTLCKIKSVREHEALPPWVREGKEGEKGEKKGEEKKAAAGKELMNVQARLFNANPTKEAMAVVVRDVRAILGVDEVVKGPQAKRARGEGEAAASKEKEKGKKKKKVKVEEESSEDVEEGVGEGESGEENEGDDAEWDSEEFAGFSDRIAGSSDSESEEEDVETQLKKRPYQPVRDLSFTPPSSREASPSGSSEPTFSDDEEEEDASPEPAPKAKSKSKEKTPIVTNKSTFLPSLSAVGYISGSESEAEDLDEEIAPQKKNRRGQRARQQLWEKKYGKGAKHLAKQKNDRNAGWDAKRGAVDGDRGKKGKFGRDSRGGGFKPGGRGPQATDANTVELGKKKNHRDDGGKLHPSWEAAKLAKEKAKLGNVQFQGKKVTFD